MLQYALLGSLLVKRSGDTKEKGRRNGYESHRVLTGEAVTVQGRRFERRPSMRRKNWMSDRSKRARDLDA